MSELLFPLQFKRQYAEALDPDVTFTTVLELNNYLYDAVRYPGQIATCQEKEGYLFIMNNARNAWIEFSTDVEPITKNNINATITVGGISKGTLISAGTRLEDILNNILSPYVSSKLKTFNVSLTPYATIYEVGVSIAIGNATFTYDNDSNGNSPIKFSINGYSFPETEFSNSPITSNGLVYSFTTPSSLSWVLSAFDANNNTIPSISYAISAQYKIFFGASPYLPTNPSWSLGQSKLNANQATTWIANSDNSNSNNYTYICYPAIYNDLSSIKLGGASAILEAFVKLTNITLTNSYGISAEYKVYKSLDPGAFGVGNTLTIL